MDWERFVAAANAQHQGGSSFSKGSDFQLFAETVEFLRIAANINYNGLGADPTFATEVKGSRVDDLHITWWFDPVENWRYQIKAVEGLQWSLKLETQFKQDRYFFPSSNYHLIVHDPDVAKFLDSEKGTKGLDFVEVDHVPIHVSLMPFNHLPIRHLLDRLIPSDEKPSHHLATWTTIFGTWARRRSGHFSEIWADICDSSKYALRPLSRTFLYDLQLANDISSTVGSLSVAAEGDTIILSNDVLFAQAPLPMRMALSDENFWKPMPSNAWDLLEKLGAIEEELE